MENRNLETLAQELGLKKQQVETVLELTAEGNTIPFIARYRKEKTGNLDETQIKAIIDMDKSLTTLQDRKETVLAKIEAQGKLTDQLKVAIEAAEKLADVEELYLPYKEKRRTKATIAREAGLFPLARLILQNSPNLKAEAEKLISEAFPTADMALAGAVDILVEAFSEDNSLRSWTYNEIWNNSDITSTLKDQSLDEKEIFKIYYDFEDKVSKLQGYRTLALNRGEKLGVIKVSFKHNLEKMHRFYSARFKQKMTISRKLSINLSRRKSFQLWSVVSEVN